VPVRPATKGGGAGDLGVDPQPLSRGMGVWPAMDGGRAGAGGPKEGATGGSQLSSKREEKNGDRGKRRPRRGPLLGLAMVCSVARQSPPRHRSAPGSLPRW
jgi:hypothetical protein